MMRVGDGPAGGRRHFFAAPLGFVQSGDSLNTESVLGRGDWVREECGMALRRMGAVLALAAMGFVGTASAAVAADYPPTSVSVSTEANSATSTTVAANPSGNASGSLPFTGGNDLELVWFRSA